MYHIPVYKIRLVKDSTQKVPVKLMEGPASAADLLSFYLQRGVWW